jgi:hypothetical protein
MRRTLLSIAAAVVAIFGFSCRHAKDSPGGPGEVAPSPEAAPPTAEEVVTETVLGRILVLGADNAFVVFQLEGGATAAAGEELEVRFAGATVGKIKVSKERRSRMVAADVVSGTVEKGYEVVRLKTEKAPVPAP